MRQQPTNWQTTPIWPGPIHRQGRLIRLAPIAWSVVIGLSIGLSGPDAAGAGATDPDPLVRTLEVAPSARPGFTRMTPTRTGIAFTNLLAESRYLTNQIYLNGSGLALGDVDGDGHEDLVLCQNFFAVSADVSRNDGGRGVWLRGDGQGGFHPVPGAECGIAVYGEGRGLAAADFDQDGRLDLAVGQNSNRTLVYRNVRGRPGLRVRLEGPPGNPESVGAVIRLVNAAGQMGPAREVHAGSGYWSQDSSTLVLAVAGAGEAQAIQVRWPGGRTTRSDIPPGASEIRVTRDGSVVPGAAFGLVPAGGPR